MSTARPVYREMAPPDDLAGPVECCWVSRAPVAAETAPTRTRVLPDGCMDILITLGAFPEPVEGREYRERAYVVGTMTRAQLFEYGGTVDIVALRFRPGGILPFVQVPPAELVDIGAPLGAFWGAEARELPERLHELPTDEERAALLFEVLRARRAHAEDRMVREAARRIRVSAGGVSIDELRRALFVSERTLERRVQAAVGLSPKRLARVARLREASGRLLTERERSISEVAVACGYYDQSHMNRDFRVLAGLTPGEWREGHVPDSAESTG